ncbi:hypothetical protein [Roseiarcus sp.]
MTRTDSIAIAAARQSALPAAHASAAAPALRAVNVAMPAPSL